MADVLVSHNHTSGGRLVVHEKVRGGAAKIIRVVSQRVPLPPYLICDYVVCK